MKSPTHDKTLVAKLAIIWLLPVGILVAYGDGARAASTNAPGETSCQAADCHTDYSLNSGTGEILVSGIPETYELGHTYEVTVTLSQPGQLRWGFQTTALGIDDTPAGIFGLIDEGTTQIKKQVIEGDTRERSYVEHTLEGSHLGVLNGPVTWTFSWQAPMENLGTIHFYTAGNAANFNRRSWGDYIYTSIDSTMAPMESM